VPGKVKDVSGSQGKGIRLQKVVLVGCCRKKTKRFEHSKEVLQARVGAAGRENLKSARLFGLVCGKEAYEERLSGEGRIMMVVESRNFRRAGCQLVRARNVRKVSFGSVWPVSGVGGL